MGPLPKRKYAKARQGKRRNHIKVSPPSTQLCPQCQSPKLPHRACPTCGYYNGREVVEVKSREKKAS
ncbi:MAG TPA: 50S ribosomal protein L32 [Dehalococcoidales bacterium]